jgi:phosphoribosylformylglycinamidine cyclo-ligase
MFRTFNMGVGYVIVVAAGQAEPALAALRSAGETAWAIGEIVAGERGVELAA